MSDTSQQGLMSHTAILNRLVQLGYEVLLPWADHLGYDLAYYSIEEHRNFGFFVHREAQLVRVQCKTGRLEKGGNCFAFNTVSTSPGKHSIRKRTYVGKAEFFAVYLPENGKVYMIAVSEAPRSSDMSLRFKSAGLVRGNHKKTYTVPYEEITDPRFHWAEDYEI
ncbi:MAG TPA: group I intron-associated PD-(D/E)XK endonuclease [Ktedonobacteraceae bacterium]|nr:group I intron-associated PD-(D/E)XK endonuclease [Ktedonobacteraceae bacterium]